MCRLIVRLGFHQCPELPEVLDVVQTEGLTLTILSLFLVDYYLVQDLLGKDQVQEGDEGFAVFQETLLSLVQLHIFLFKLFHFLL